MDFKSKLNSQFIFRPFHILGLANNIKINHLDILDWKAAEVFRENFIVKYSGS